MEANHQGPKGEIKDNHENGRKYVRITKTPYQNVMLGRRVLRIEKRLVGHRLFLP